MANAVAFDGHASLASTFEYPINRGVFTTSGLVKVERQSLPIDPIGTTTVTFTGALAGTEIHVYLQDGTELAGVESSTANPALTWSVYSPGLNSTVYITLIKRGYRWQRFDYTPNVGPQSIQIFPLPDLGYNNPI